MSDPVKEVFQGLGFAILLAGFLLFAAVTLCVTCGADEPFCSKPMRRFEYVFPARQLGCWLGGVP